MHEAEGFIFGLSYHYYAATKRDTKRDEDFCPSHKNSKFTPKSVEDLFMLFQRLIKSLDIDLKLDST